jgi:histone acetyltransferase (RNA polymerase elongator complex component)
VGLVSFQRGTLISAQIIEKGITIFSAVLTIIVFIQCHSCPWATFCWNIVEFGFSKILLCHETKVHMLRLQFMIMPPFINMANRITNFSNIETRLINIKLQMVTLFSLCIFPLKLTFTFFFKLELA